GELHRRCRYTGADMGQEDRNGHALHERRLAGHIRTGNKSHSDVRGDFEIVSDGQRSKKGMKESAYGQSRGRTWVRTRMLDCGRGDAPAGFDLAHALNETRNYGLATIAGQLIERSCDRCRCPP